MYNKRINLIVSHFYPRNFQFYSYYSVSIFCKLGVNGFLGTIVMFILMFFGQIAGVILVDKVNQPLALC